MSERSNGQILKFFGIILCVAIGMVLFVNQYSRADDRAAERTRRVNGVGQIKLMLPPKSEQNTGVHKFRDKIASLLHNLNHNPNLTQHD